MPDATRAFVSADPVLIDAYRVTGEQVRREYARIRWCESRELEIRLMWHRTPDAPIAPLWAHRGPSGTVPLCVDVAAYVAECDADPDAVLGLALVDSNARAALLNRYARTRADVEVARIDPLQEV